MGQDAIDTTHSGRKCCLCGTQLVLRARDPLLRVLGLALVYVAAMVLLLVLPEAGWGAMAGAAVLAACGLVLARNTKTLWCPNCWFETRAAESAGQSEREAP